MNCRCRSMIINGMKHVVEIYSLWRFKNQNINQFLSVIYRFSVWTLSLNFSGINVKFFIEKYWIKYSKKLYPLYRLNSPTFQFSLIPRHFTLQKSRFISCLIEVSLWKARLHFSLRAIKTSKTFPCQPRNCFCKLRFQ